MFRILAVSAVEAFFFDPSLGMVEKMMPKHFTASELVTRPAIVRQFDNPINRLSEINPSFKVNDPNETPQFAANQNVMKQLVDDMNAGTYDPDVFMSRELSKIV